LVSTGAADVSRCALAVPSCTFVAAQVVRLDPKLRPVAARSRAIDHFGLKQPTGVVPARCGGRRPSVKS